MTQLPNLKFDKNRKFLTEQLEIQKAKVNNITDIISNIKSISQSKTCNVYYLNDLLDTGNGLIAEINANIVSIEALFACLEEITTALSTILSPENQKGKTKSYYIDSFTKLEKGVTDYSKNFNKIMKKLENDNTTYDTFIASCNLNSSSDSFSSNPDQIRQILEKNLVEQENTFASIADSYKVENDIDVGNVEDDTNDEEIEDEQNEDINTIDAETNNDVAVPVLEDTLNNTADTIDELATENTVDDTAEVVTDSNVDDVVNTEITTTTTEPIAEQEENPVATNINEIAEENNDEQTNTINSQDAADNSPSVSGDITADDLDLLTDEDILDDVEIDMIENDDDTSVLNKGNDSSDNIESDANSMDVSLEDFEITESETHEISLEATDDIPQIEPAMQVDTSVNAPAIESFIDENMELPDIQIKDEDYTDSDIAEDTNSIESISLSDDLQEIIDDVNNSNDTETETINAISEGFEGLINASTSYTIDALKKSNRDFYDNLRNLSFEYDDFSTPISQLEKKSKTVPAVSSNYQVKDIDTAKNKEVTPNEIKTEIKERPKTEQKSILDNVISNRVVSNITNEETPEVEINAINNSTDTIILDTSDIRKFTNVLNTPNNSTDLDDEEIDEDMDSSSIIDNEDDNKADEESLFNIQDELISNLDEVEILADALNSSENITITMQDKDSDEEAVVKGSTDNTVTPRMTSLSKDKIEKIIKAEADNETLIISEKNNKIYLPYKMSEIKNYMHSYPDSYKDASDVVKQEFILDLSEFMQHPSKTRFQETYTLIRNRDGKSVASAVLYGLKLVKKSNLSPAVIAACKHKDELDRYLNCLKENKLDEFKAFNIMYEINPHKT